MSREIIQIAPSCFFPAALLDLPSNIWLYILFSIKYLVMAMKKHGGSLLIFIVVGLAIISLSACKNTLLGEAALVLTEKMDVRSSTAKASRSIGGLKRGDQVTIVERVTEGDTAYVRIKGPDGMDGWTDVRNLVTQQNIDKSKEIAATVAEISTQAECKNKSTVKLRLSADRASDDNVLAQLPAGTTFEIVVRETRPKATDKNVSVKAAAPKAGNETDDKDNPGAASYEVWYKVRVKDNTILPAGYVYGGSVDLDYPREISYFFQEGKKIVGWQKLGAMKDGKGQDNHHYVILEKSYSATDDKSDFDYLHIVGFDPKNKSVSYYNVWRENIKGVFPLTVNVEDKRATFQFKSLDKDNKESLAQYVVEQTEKGHLKASRPGASDDPKDPRRK